MNGDHPTSSWQPAPVADYYHFEIRPLFPLHSTGISCYSLCLASSGLLLYTSRSLHLLYKLPLSNWRWQWVPPLNLLFKETQLFQFLCIYCAPALYQLYFDIIDTTKFSSVTMLSLLPVVFLYLLLPLSSFVRSLISRIFFFSYTKRPTAWLQNAFDQSQDGF